MTRHSLRPRARGPKVTPPVGGWRGTRYAAGSSGPCGGSRLQLVGRDASAGLAASGRGERRKWASRIPARAAQGVVPDPPPWLARAGGCRSSCPELPVAIPGDRFGPVKPAVTVPPRSGLGSPIQSESRPRADARWVSESAFLAESAVRYSSRWKRLFRAV